LGGGFLSVGAADTSTTYSGALSGSGELIKVGTGTFTLTGNSPAYRGTTRVSNGTVIVNANQSAAAVVVEAGATLSGTGTVGAITTTGGTVVPGQGPGILNAVGNVAFDSDSSLVVDINGTTPGTKYDQLKVTGAVDLGNVNLVLNPISGVAIGDSFAII